jgi:hypothetical protein
MIIGFGYTARSGKDTAGDHLARKYLFTKTSFAGPLKLACQTIFGFNHYQVTSAKEDIDQYWGITPRAALQRVGTDLLRNQFREDIWVKSVERYIKTNKAMNWVITDVRFPNEADAIKRWGGYVYRIDRPGAGVGAHESETAMADYPRWDGVIVNDSTLPEFYRRVEEVCALGTANREVRDAS